MGLGSLEDDLEPTRGKTSHPEQIRAFLNGSEPVDFNPVSRDEAYAFVSRTLSRFGCARLGKPDRGW